MLTVQQAIELGVRHTLHGAPAAEISERHLLNLAGQHLVSMHSWQWLQRKLTTAGVVAGRDWVELPSDLTRLKEININGDLSATVRLTDTSTIMGFRRSNVIPAATTFWVAPVYRVCGTERSPRLVLEIWPLATDTNNELFLIDYAGGWTEITAEVGETQGLSLPLDGTCDALYIEILRAFAKGWEEDDQTNLQQALVMIESGPVFESAKRADNRRVANRGRVYNGLVETTNRHLPQYRLYLDSLPEGYVPDG